MRKFIYIVLFLLIAAGFYFWVSRNAEEQGVVYRNSEYGFVLNLLESWRGYSIVGEEWEGYIPDDGKGQVFVAKGPLVLVRHPGWTEAVPRQDIPIMVFTVSQWNDMQRDKFHIGAAPINPSELGRNTKYVFALPARYNFAYLPGFEEVDQIVRSTAFQPI